MLRAEQGDKIYAGGREQYVDGRIKMAVNAAGVGHETDFFTDERCETIVPEDLDTGLYLSRRKGAERSEQDGCCQNKFFHLKISYFTLEEDVLTLYVVNCKEEGFVNLDVNDRLRPYSS